jgi:hypothetical protein
MTNAKSTRLRTTDAMPSFSQLPAAASNGVSRSLFHYTTAGGLIGILQSQSLFATHANFLNDSAECRILSRLLKPQIAGEIAEIVPTLIKRGRLIGDVYKEHGEKIHEMQAEAALDSIFTSIEKIAPFYITSFCIHDPTEPEYENGLLSQWRGYANGGFAIEFDELAIDELGKAENNAHRYQGILTDQVSYDGHSKRAKIEQFKGIGKAFLRKLFEDQGGDLVQDFGDEIDLHKFTRPFLEVLPFLKDPGFSEEREYRIAALCNRPGVAEDGDVRTPKELLFRESKSGSVIPYVPLFAGLGTKLPIKGILIGPHVNQANQANALSLLLERCGIDVEVRPSKLTFRST